MQFIDKLSDNDTARATIEAISRRQREEEGAETFIRFTMRVAGRFEDAAPAWPASAWAGHGEHASFLLAWPSLAWPGLTCWTCSTWLDWLLWLRASRREHATNDNALPAATTATLTATTLLCNFAGQLEWEQQLAAYLSIFMCACTPWGMQRTGAVQRAAR